MMGERLNAALVIDGQVVAMKNDVSLDVRVCDVCGGSGRRVVMARYPLRYGYGWRIVREHHPCAKCWQSGYVVRIAGGEA